MSRALLRTFYNTVLASAVFYSNMCWEEPLYPLWWIKLLVLSFTSTGPSSSGLTNCMRGQKVGAQCELGGRRGSWWSGCILLLAFLFVLCFLLGGCRRLETQPVTHTCAASRNQLPPHHRGRIVSSPEWKYSLSVHFGFLIWLVFGLICFPLSKERGKQPDIYLCNCLFVNTTSVDKLFYLSYSFVTWLGQLWTY